MANLEEMFTDEERVQVFYASDEQKKNPRVAMYNMMLKVESLAQFYKEALTDEVVDYAIEHGFVLPSYYNSDLFSNYKLAYYLVEQNPENLFHVDSNILTEKIITMALDKGLQFDPKNYRLMDNEKFLKVVVSRDVNLLNYAPQEAITDEIIEIAKKKKFVFEFNGEREVKKPYYENFSDDLDLLMPNNNLHLLKYDELVISSFINGYEAIIFEEEIPTSNKYYDYMVEKALSDKISFDSLRNFKLYENEVFNTYINNNLFVTESSRTLMQKYLKEKYIKENLELSSYVLRDEFVEEFGQLLVDMIIKYLICPKSEFKIDIILKEISIKDLKNIFDLLYNEKGGLKVLQVQKIVNYFASNMDLLKQILNSNINEVNIDKLRILINENNQDIKVNDVNELNNLNNIRYDVYNKACLKTVDKVFRYLTGRDYSEFYNMQQEEITSFRYKQLLDKNDNLEDQKIVSYLEYLEAIEKLSGEQLDNVWLKLQNNNMDIHLLDEIVRSFKNNFFTNYRNNLTKIKDKKASYFEGDVPVFEYNGEDFSFIAHAFNAFDSKYIEDNVINSMYTPTISRSYVATSYINQNHYSLAVMNETCVNFIFSDFSNENLIASSYEDIYINGEQNNSMDVTVHHSKYLDPFEMACLTYKYNEMDFYRINNNDYKSIPSAVLCYDEVKNRSRVIAAQYQLPIVLIKTKAYRNLNNELFEKYKEEITKGDITHIKEILGLSRKLQKSFNEEELSAMLEGVPLDRMEELLSELRIFEYDKNIIENIRNKYVSENIDDVKKL